MNLRDRFSRFMIGRYGTDEFSKFLLILAMVMMVLNLIIRIRLVNTLILVLLIYVYYRMFSRNIQKRYDENCRYLQQKNKLTGWKQKQKRTMADRKVNHIYRCPNCKQKIRIPKGKGKICITCPKCRTEFTKKS